MQYELKTKKAASAARKTGKKFFMAFAVIRPSEGDYAAKKRQRAETLGFLSILALTNMAKLLAVASSKARNVRGIPIRSFPLIAEHVVIRFPGTLDGDKELIRFTYQRFSDHMIVKSVLSRTPKNKLKQLTKPKGVFRDLTFSALRPFK